MSKHLIHFQDQLAATNNPDPLLDYFEEIDGDPRDVRGGFPRLNMDRTRKSQIYEHLVGMKFIRMHGTVPVFKSELVEVE